VPVTVASGSLSNPLLLLGERPGEISDRFACGNGVADLHGWLDRLVGRSESGSRMFDCDHGGSGHGADEGHAPATDGPNDASWEQLEVDASMACAPYVFGHIEPLRDSDGGYRPRPQTGDDEDEDPRHDGSLGVQRGARLPPEDRGAWRPSEDCSVEDAPAGWENLRSTW
jgi:hypothetical protein